MQTLGHSPPTRPTPPSPQSRSWSSTAPPPQAATAAPTAPAVDGAARATPARQLPLRTVHPHPLALPNPLASTTSPCQQQNGGSPASLSAAMGPTSPPIYRPFSDSPRHRAVLQFSLRATPSHGLTGRGHLLHLRPRHSPPPFCLFRHHQSPSLRPITTISSTMTPRILSSIHFCPGVQVCKASSPPEASSPP